MTEAARSYYEDVSTRAIVKKSAQHKKNGSAVQKLGNRRMSWQEIYSKHGEVKTYDMEKFMTFSEFKEMPKDLQVEYVNKLQDKYDISIKHISRYLFNVGDGGLQSHLKMFDILKPCNPDKHRGKTGLKQFQDDITEFKRRERASAVIDICEEKARIEEGPQFMTFEEFDALSKDDQVDYVNALINKYKVSNQVISVDMLGKSHAYLSNRRYTKKMVKSGEHDPNKIKENRKRFLNDLKKWRAESDIPVVEETTSPVFEFSNEEMRHFEAEESYVPVEEFDEDEDEAQTELKNRLLRCMSSETSKEHDALCDKANVPVTASTEEDTELIFDANPHDHDFNTIDYISNHVGVGLNETEWEFLHQLLKDKDVEFIKVEITSTDPKACYSSYYAEYEGIGLSENEWKALPELFRGKRVSSAINVIAHNNYDPY